MRYKFVLLGIVLCLFVTATLAAPIEQVELTSRISELILEYYPEAEIAQDNGNLNAKYGTMIFTVHGQRKAGRIPEKTHQVEGPNFKGFMFSIFIKNGEYVGQALVPQTINERYWQTYIDRPPTDDGNSHYVINFSYGSGLDRKFMSELFEALPKTKMPTKE